MIDLGDKILFRNVAELWIRKKETIVKRSTYIHYYNLLENHIIPKLGDKSINNITLLDLEEIITSLLVSGRLDNGGGLSKKTVSDITIIIKSIMKYAETLGFSLSCNPTLISISQPTAELKILNHKEQFELNEYLMANDDFISLGILIALYTGVRIGELCALIIDDFDTNMNKITIRKTLQRLQHKQINCENKTYIAITAPKSKNSIREVPVPDFIIKKIMSIGYNDGSYILTGLPDKFIEPRTMENRFNKIARHLSFKNVSFHTLRHTFATRCIEVGVDAKTLSETLGHSNVNTTLNRYVHSSFEMKQKSLQKLNYTRI